MSGRIKKISCVEMGIVSNILMVQFGIDPLDDAFVGAAQQIIAIGEGFSDNNVDGKDVR